MRESWFPGIMTTDSQAIVSTYSLASAYSSLKPKVVRSPEMTTMSGSMSLTYVIARSSRFGRKNWVPQCRSEICTIVNVSSRVAMREV